jgi:hypothetical protein
MLLRNTRLCECRIAKAQVNLCFRSVDRALRCNNSGADWNLADRLNRCGNNRKPRPLEATGVFEPEEPKFEINIRRC